MITVIIPAHNEAQMIGPCLRALLASVGDMSVQVIVVANGCTDATVEIAESYLEIAVSRGWVMRVLDLPDGGKLGALNAGDAAAQGEMRMYLDADVVVSAQLLCEIYDTLNCDVAKYASGSLEIPTPTSTISIAYRSLYQQVPFMTHGVPGAGLFAMNKAGRDRWGVWPDIISDDTFARLQFTPSERCRVDASYTWPIVEGWSNLVAVRRRQNAGVDEVRKLFPELLNNDDTPTMSLTKKISLVFSNPFGFAVYTGVALMVRLTRPKGRGDWRRGR